MPATPDSAPARPGATRSRRPAALVTAGILLGLVALGAVTVIRRTRPIEAGPTAAAAASQPEDGTIDLTFKKLEFDPGEKFAGVHVTSNMAVKLPPGILALDGKRVRITGFLVPILNAGGRIREFFIMSSQSSCCFGTAPRLFDFIDATMPEGTDIKDLGDPVVFEGVLHVRRTPAEDEWIPLFTMDAEAVYRD
jgi:hypothetical protein